MKGDWVQAQYFINPTEWTTQAHSVVPLRYSRLDQVTFFVLQWKCLLILNSLHLPTLATAFYVFLTK